MPDDDRPRPASNKYTRILGLLALAVLLLGLVTSIIQATSSSGGISGQQPSLAGFYIAAGLGVIWLAVKAVLAGPDR